MSSADVRRWLEGFEAAERADRDVKRRDGPQPEWSIRVALSLIDAARTAAGAPLVDPRREAGEEAVRNVWNRLRTRLRR
jgi:hypothetical protein